MRLPRSSRGNSVANAGDHREMEIFPPRPVQDHAVRVDQAEFGAGAQKTRPACAR